MSAAQKLVVQELDQRLTKSCDQMLSVCKKEKKQSVSEKSGTFVDIFSINMFGCVQCLKCWDILNKNIVELTYKK